MGAASTSNIFEWSVMDILYKFTMHSQVDNIHLFKTINLMLIWLMHDTNKESKVSVEYYINVSLHNISVPEGDNFGFLLQTSRQVHYVVQQTFL